MMPRFRTLLAAGSLGLLPSLAPAQSDGPPCAAGPAVQAGLAEDLTNGTWSVRHNAGYVVAQGMVMGHPASGTTETGRFDLRDGRLVLQPHGSPMVVEFDWVSDQSWNFDTEASLPEDARTLPGQVGEVPDLAITDEDVTLLTDCPSDDLPRLVGRGSTTVEGTRLDFTLRLIMVGPNTLYGFQQVDAQARGIPVMERRTFVMSRN